MKKNLLGISLITMSCLYGMLAAVIILIFILIDVPVIYGIGISICALLLQFVLSPSLTDLSMKWFYKASFGADIPEYLENFIKEICSKYNMKYPRIGYIDDGAPNAFTYGMGKNDARIVLTRGIFDLLSEEEVKAVVAHELGHATHYDMLFMTVAQLVPLILYGIYENFANQMSDGDDDSSKLAIIGFIAYFLYIISQYVILWLSRTREYYADSFAIEETKNPNALAEALVKVGYGLSTSSSSNSKHSASRSNALGIFDSKTSKSLVVSSAGNGVISKENIKGAMKWEMWNIWAKLYELNSTHPLISKRLKAIASRSREFGQIPYIDFDIIKPESYFDDFLFELFIDFLPTLIVFITIASCFMIPESACLVMGLGGVLAVAASFKKLSITHNNKVYPSTDVVSLLNEVKVSGVTSVPCEVKGTIIGRGNPGCILNEDFVIKDNTGIMLLDYNQPIHIINKIFALFKSKEYFDKTITVKGWYRRSPVPYIEIYTMEIDGKIKKCHTYTFSKIFRIILLALCIFLIFMNFA